MDPTADDLIARLRRNPEDAAALTALKIHYRNQGAFETLANLLEVRAARTRDRKAAAEAFAEAAGIVEVELGDPRRALALYERALDRHPATEEAAQAVERLLEAQGDAKRLLEVLERRATALGAAKADPMLRAELHHRIGQRWQSSGQRTERALYHYRKAFELDPKNVHAIYAAREIYRASGNHRAAVELYQIEVDAETDPDRKILLLRELAALRADALSDVDGAIVALDQALAVGPDDLHVMHDLSSALLRRIEQGGRENEIHALRERVSELLVHMASLVPTEHALAYCEAALDAVPAHELALDRLETLAVEAGVEDRLAIRWIRYLELVPDGAESDRRRFELGRAYLKVGQIEDAVSCFEPLLAAQHVGAAEALIPLYEQLGRSEALPEALALSLPAVNATERKARLHRLVAALIEVGRIEEAAVRAQELLALDPEDLRAMEVLEGAYRKRGDAAGLAELLLRFAGSGTVPFEQRRKRYLEAAKLLEGDLADPRRAIEAWSALAELDPEAIDPHRELARLYERTGDVDAWIHELELLASTAVDARSEAEFHRKLAELHRDKRGDLGSAIDALTKVRQLTPDDDGARDALCSALLTAERYSDAVPLLEERASTAAIEERADHLRLLATVLEEKLGDPERAYSAWSELLDIIPDDAEAFDRMERIDGAYARFERMLDTQERRALAIGEEAQPALLARMAFTAEHRLHDRERACSYYERALALAPRDTATIEALVQLYEKLERFDEMVALLRKRADLENDPDARRELHRRAGRILADQLGTPEEAKNEWAAILESGEDEEALRRLRDLAESEADASLPELIGRLANVVETDAEKLELRFEQACLLIDRFDRREDAKAILLGILDGLDRAHAPTLDRLVELAEALGDAEALADALERKLAVTGEDGERVPLASRLADVYETDLEDVERAITALRAWSEADLTETTPRERLAELLEKAERHDELLDVLDELSGIELDPEAAGAYVRQAARLALEAKSDVEGAFGRLADRVEEDDEQAEELLREIALRHDRQNALAELFVRLAQKAPDPLAQRKRWLDAASVLESHVKDVSRALEATLRAFALALSDRELLAEVDRLATEAKAFARLHQVYDSLIRRAEEIDEKVELATRHARLLDESADDASAAFDRMRAAAALVLDRDEVLAMTENLAKKAGRAADLLPLYERAAEDAHGEARAERLTRAAKLCVVDLEEHDRAAGYLGHTIVALEAEPARLDELEDAMRTWTPDASFESSALGVLVGVYRTIADAQSVSDPERSGALLARAARLLDGIAKDPRAALALYEQATAWIPGDAAMLDEYQALAEREGSLEAFGVHLARLVDEALDSGTAAALLRRQGELLEGPLQKPLEAAEVYRQLQLLSDDEEVSERLRSCLRKVGKHQDVLLVLDRELERAVDTSRRVALLREIAHLWDRELQNRFEALEAYGKLLEEAPADEEALAAVERLRASTRRLTSDETPLGVDVLDETEV